MPKEQEKDPAFLFYSKDWIQGTSYLSPAEKGVYIDLLANQHQNGYLPKDPKRLCRIVSLPENDFLEIWSVLSEKFVETENNRLVNRKLTKVVTERSTGSLKNKITGILASLVRLSPEPYEVKEKIKKSFKIDDFLTEPTDTLTERLTGWWADRLKSIGNGNAIGNANTNGFKGGYGGKEKAIKINPDLLVAVFADGGSQPLDEGQVLEFQRGTLTPSAIRRK